MRRPRKSINQINVVPYIDVMLVLLIIFMVTAPLISPGVIDVPTVREALPPPKSPGPPLEIVIKGDRSLLFRDQASSSATPQKISEPDLVSTVRLLHSRNPDQSVVIAADKSVRYEEVIRILDLMRQLEIKSVGLLARQSQ